MRVIGAMVLYSLDLIVAFVRQSITLGEVETVVMLTFFTMMRVIALIALATLVWVPIGVWIGLRPRVAEKVQPLAQFMAAFPANVLFPIAVVGILRFRLDPGHLAVAADHLRHAMVYSSSMSSPAPPPFPMICAR